LSREDFSSSVSSSVRKLINDKDFTDVTLVSENNRQIKAHKVILNSGSKFFKNILTMNHHQHPLVYLKGVKHEQLQHIMELIYLGEVKIGESEVDSFVQLGKDLEVEGLVDEEQEEIQEDATVTEPITPKVEMDYSLLEKVYDDAVVTCEEIDVSNQNKEINSLRKKKIKRERNENGQFACAKCDFSTEHLISLKKHTLSKHDEVRFQCERCEKNYSDSSALLRHRKSFHEGLRHTCDICKGCFTESGSLIKHKKNMHPSMDQLNSSMNQQIPSSQQNSSIAKQNTSIDEHIMSSIDQQNSSIDQQNTSIQPNSSTDQ